MLKIVSRLSKDTIGRPFNVVDPYEKDLDNISIMRLTFNAEATTRDARARAYILLIKY